ncbi:protein of unknown function DUF1023 [Kribbella flavida DSM 17836]|uniref:DUF1023 domain-containing protein n=1 Tax=Kribbella flavida (strain DSM 17836 / JCM 10339 / NBRC 14399) TaxID=479435 RepID=D2Q2J9_KRIFD|nr:alpha/beta hydrolase [Kribbella flavida]ADB35895.1 protein of unknown function DUF1023 [Kribbella flavida DSM 17836]
MTTDELAKRFQANHLRLVAARDRLHGLVEAGTATPAERKRLDTVQELLTPVTSTELDSTGKLVQVSRARQFLHVDPDGQGRAVEVLGELDAAGNVAVLVPGMGNSLDTFRDQSDRGNLIQQEAGPGTAVVVWLDYPSPPDIPAAISPAPAQEAGPQLAKFLAEVDGIKPVTAKLTVIGHSYGSVVTGYALRAGARADRVVLTGSPGAGRGVDAAAELVPPGTSLYVERAPGDVVSYTQWHGPDPANYSDAVRMATNAPGADPVRGHDEYYRTNTESLRNIGRVIRGDLSRITTTATSAAAETRVLPWLSWSEPVRIAAQAVSKVYDGMTALTKATRHAVRSAGGGAGGRAGGTAATTEKRRSTDRPRRPGGPDR